MLRIPQLRDIIGSFAFSYQSAVCGFAVSRSPYNSINGISTDVASRSVVRTFRRYWIRFLQLLPANRSSSCNFPRRMRNSIWKPRGSKTFRAAINRCNKTAVNSAGYRRGDDLNEGGEKGGGEGGDSTVRGIRECADRKVRNGVERRFAGKKKKKKRESQTFRVAGQNK